MAERATALALLVLAAPLLGLLALVVFLLDGWPVFYAGERLGLRKQSFTMFKLRTLRLRAERRVVDRPIESRDGLEIRGGRLLRDSRLDELPQLWNIVRGQMSFIGPRPERPQVYRARCQSIPEYDLRFHVRPGLIGPSQLFTPHTTDKRIRSALDNAWIHRKRSGWVRGALVLYTPLVMGWKLVTRALECAVDDVLRCRLLHRTARTRRLRRVKPRSAVVVFDPVRAFPSGALARLVDVNDESFLVQSRRLLNVDVGERFPVRLEIELGGERGARRIRSARCLAVVAQKRRREDGQALVLKYWPLTPRSDYVIQQYFLRSSLVPSRARPARRRLVTGDELVPSAGTVSTT